MPVPSQRAVRALTKVPRLLRWSMRLWSFRLRPMRGWWLVSIALSLACAPAGSTGRGAFPSSTARGAAAFEDSGAATYSTRPVAAAVRGGSDAERIEATLIEVARRHKMDLVGDGRLADLGTRIG